MALIEWQDNYSVKVKLFDEHHKQLIKIINQLDQHIKEGKSLKELEKCFSKLIEYTQIHFDSEETLLAQYKYPGIHDQENEHRAFVDNLKQLRHAFKEDVGDIEHQVLEFLQNWLVHHILKSDQAYSEFLNDKGVE